MPKVVVTVICVVLLGLSFFSWLPSPEPKDFIRTGLNIVLMWFLWQGANWARWVVGVLSGLAAMTMAVFLYGIEIQSTEMLLLWIMGAVYAAISILLISGWIIGPYFKKSAA